MISSGNAGINSPQFITDFLVTHINPSIEVVTKRIGNLRLRQRVIQLFPPNEKPDLLEYTKKTQLSIIETFSQSLPEWFSKDQYISRIQGALREYLDSNKELSSTLEQLESKKPEFDKPASVKVFRDTIILLGGRMSEWYSQYENYSAELLLISDLPGDYFLLSKDAELAQLSAFNIYEKSIKKLSTRLSIARDFIKFSQNARTFKSDLSPLMASGRLVSDCLSRLNFFLDISNSTDMDEMFRLSPYTVEKTDMKRLESYLQDLELALASMNEELVPRLGFVHETVPLSETTERLQRDIANIALTANF
jgi:hypothetical protein